MQSDKQVGDFLDDKDFAFAETLITLFKHEKSLPDDSSFCLSQRLENIFILTNSFPQQPESDLLSTSLTKHHKATHPHLINVDVQQLPTYVVSLVVKIKEGSVVSQHVNLFQSILT